MSDHLKKDIAPPPAEQIKVRERVLSEMLVSDCRPTTIPTNRKQLAEWIDAERGIQAMSRSILYWSRNRAMVTQCLSIAAELSARWSGKKKPKQKTEAPSRRAQKLALGSISSRYHEARNRVIELENEVILLKAELKAVQRRSA